MNIQYIFVHGLSGWGSYDEQYEKSPYWGMKNGDAVQHLRELGYDCKAASVAPKGSAWDRACELYAQLAGTVTDYGKAHSEKAGHARFGRGFSSCPLVPAFDEEHPVVLIGHSFGGATVRLFSELMANGCPGEKEQTDPAELSGFFAGGKESWIHAIVTLAAPHNGTTAYDMYQDPGFDPNSVKVPLSSNFFAYLTSRSTKIETDGRADYDYASHDMYIDNADALNRKIHTLPSVYYYSWPAACTEEKDGKQYPVKKKTEPFMFRSSARMGAYTGKTKGGITIDASWQKNDGLVNTVSAEAPSHSPAKAFDPGHVEPGVWNIMPLYPYDHMSFQGGLMHKHDIFPFYEKMMRIISAH